MCGLAWARPASAGILARAFESRLKVGVESYPYSLRGIEQICMGRPQLCALSWQQAHLVRLRHRRALGVTLLAVGGATAGIGALALLFGQAQDGCAKTNSCSSGHGVLTGITVGGALVVVAGGLTVPGDAEFMHFINRVNDLHLVSPIELAVQTGPLGQFAVGMGCHF